MTVLVYGAYGYTGELVVEAALDRGIDVIAAGRDEERVDRLGSTLGCETRTFEIEAAAGHLDDVGVLLNCAGPFVRTYEPLVEACLTTETHYLDITGELPVFEAIAERDREAEKAGICLLPGVGFEVVPADCLAGHLHDRLPDANELRLGFDYPMTVSGGTLASVIEHASASGKIRHDGDIVDVPLAHRSRRIDFGGGERNAVTVPSGDVSTAYYTTGIENVEVYASMPVFAETAMKMSQFVAPLARIEPVKQTLQTIAKTAVSGPSERRRRRYVCYVWGEATDGETTVTSRLKTPETYTLTVDAATTAAKRVLKDAPAGFQTPAAAFTPEFVLELDGVEGFFDD